MNFFEDLPDVGEGEVIEGVAGFGQGKVRIERIISGGVRSIGPPGGGSDLAQPIIRIKRKRKNREKRLMGIHADFTILVSPPG